jgi:hypothetical protein
VLASRRLTEDQSHHSDKRDLSSGIGGCSPGRFCTVRVKRRGSSRQTRGFHETEKTLVTCQDSESDSCERVRLPGRGSASGESEADGCAGGGNIPEALEMLARSPFN